MPKPGSESGTRSRDPDIVIAAKNNDTAGVLAALANDPTCINARQVVTGMTALHWACANRNLEIVTLLLGEERLPPADAFITDYINRLPVDLARLTGSKPILQRLTEWLDDHVVQHNGPGLDLV